MINKNLLNGVLLGANLAFAGFLMMGSSVKNTIPVESEAKEEKIQTIGINSMDPMLGEITMFAGNFAPRGWAICDGSLLSINENSALFSILGLMYGGDGRTTFALPDFRGRVVIQQGRGPGLSEYKLAQINGEERVDFIAEQVTSATEAGVMVAKYLQSGIDNRQPFIAVNYIIALQGIYPSRN